MTTPARVSLDLPVRKTPDEVRGWWLGFPEDYRAADSREQPFRIRTLSRTPTRIEVETFWSGPFGSSSRVEETLRVKDDGSWTADLTMMGLAIHDEFRAEPAAEGARVRIESTITPVTMAARLAAPLMLPLLKKRMERTWRDAVAICEAETGAQEKTNQPATNPSA